MKLWSDKLDRPLLHSIFFGGGTPSLIGADSIGRIFEAVRESFEFKTEIEISLEANPEDLSTRQIEELYSVGLNRLSFGVQSFNPLLLGRLGRCHNEGTVRNGVLGARRAGFDNLSFDLIYGIPTQTFHDWQESLNVAVSLEPDHISTYELSLEPWTKMGQWVKSGEEQLPGEDSVIEMYEWSQSYLSAQDYEQYEISNFARPGRKCIHNLKTWQQGEYIGVGLAAHSHLNGYRFRNAYSLQSYLSSNPVTDGCETRVHFDIYRPSQHEVWSEALVLGLRLNEGIVLSGIKERIGIEMPHGLRQSLKQFKAQGLMEQTGDRLLLTPRGQMVSDSLFAELVA